MFLADQVIHHLFDQIIAGDFMVHGCSAVVLHRKHYDDVSTGERSYVQRCYGHITVLYHWKENMCCNYSLYDQMWKSTERLEVKESEWFGVRESFLSFFR